MARRALILAPALALLASAALQAEAYLPGVAPKDYRKNDLIPLKVNKLNSIKTHVPYEHYHLPFCPPPEGFKNDPENLGEYLLGDTIQNSAYQILMMKSEECSILCRQVYDKKDLKKFYDMIKEDYHTNWLVDNLPVGAIPESDPTVVDYSKGHLVGQIFAPDPRKATEEELSYAINNHVTITIEYNVVEKSEGTYRIVGATARPYTVQHRYIGDWKTNPKLITCPVSDESAVLYAKQAGKDFPESLEVVWTYDVKFVESTTTWSERWDKYFVTNAASNQVHWFSILNSVLIVIFLAGMVGVIMMRTLRRDISRYNRVPTEEERAEEREEFGWKLVHADVFRPPMKKPMLFCVFAGTGLQLLWMSILTLLFACFGFLTPANRGALMVALLLCYVLMGASAGYYAAQTYKMFKGKQWQKCTLYTAFLFPGTAFGIFFLINLFLWAQGSSAAVPFGSMFAVLLLWFGISIPLVFAGAWYGFKQPPVSFPVATSNIPRPIPLQAWYMNNWWMAVVGGMLPFGAVFVELFYILSSLWLDQYYTLFGFMFLVFLILLITCSEITIVLIYFQLCSEDYHWWWRSFITSGSCGILVFLYSCYYYVTQLQLDEFAGAMMFFGYMFIISYGLFLVCGTTGYTTCFWFVRKIYGSIKVD